VAPELDDLRAVGAWPAYHLGRPLVEVKCGNPFDPHPASESAIEEEVGISAPGKNPFLKEILEPKGDEVPTRHERLREADVQSQVLSVDHLYGASVDPEVSVAVETLAAKPPFSRSSGRGGEADGPPVRPFPRVAPSTRLKGVAAVPAVGKVDSLAVTAAALQPAPADPTLDELPVFAEVDSLAERCFDHR
jgi:hypothetical protein